jgi:hypothetical protein
MFEESAMNTLPDEPESSRQRVVTGAFGRSPQQYAELVAEQAAEIEQLRARMMCMRGEMIVQRTALAFAEEERAALEAAAPGLPRRAKLARRVDALMTRVQDLMREGRPQPRRHALPPVVPGLRGKSVLCLGRPAPDVDAARELVERSGGVFRLQSLPSDAREFSALEACLAAADLVVCQIGQVGQEACRRVQEYCLRAGKHCLMVGGSAVALPKMVSGMIG